MVGSPTPPKWPLEQRRNQPNQLALGGFWNAQLRKSTPFRMGRNRVLGTLIAVGNIPEMCQPIGVTETHRSKHQSGYSVFSRHFHNQFLWSLTNKEYISISHHSSWAIFPWMLMWICHEWWQSLTNIRWTMYKQQNDHFLPCSQSLLASSWYLAAQLNN